MNLILFNRFNDIVYIINKIISNNKYLNICFFFFSNAQWLMIHKLSTIWIYDFFFSHYQWLMIHKSSICDTHHNLMLQNLLKMWFVTLNHYYNDINYRICDFYDWKRDSRTILTDFYCYKWWWILLEIVVAIIGVNKVVCRCTKSKTTTVVIKEEGKG